MIAAMLIAGCSGGAKQTQHTTPMPDMMPAAGPLLTSIVVTPPMAMVTSTDATPGTVKFTAVGHYADGSTADVTQTMQWSLSDSTLGTVAGGSFVGASARGGSATVTITDSNSGTNGTATLLVLYSSSRVSGDDGSTAPANAGTFFTGTENPALAPALAYPLDGAKVPSNLGLLEVQWAKPTSPVDLFEVSFSSSTIDYKVYTNAIQPSGGRLSLTPAEWSMIPSANPGQTVQVKVRGTLSTAPGTLGTSTIANLTIDPEPAQGAIYYFAPESPTDPNSGVIMRHEFGDTSGPATQFYAPTASGTTNARCVGCHALTRDGTKVGVTWDGGNGDAGVLDVASLAAVVPELGGRKWNFASFSPDGNRMVASSEGVLSIYDTSGGAANGTILQQLTTGAAGSVASHPDWSADGTQITWVSVGAPETDGHSTIEEWHFTAGSIVVATDMGMGTFAPPVTLVASTPGINNYYPSFSPDGKWILFNRGSNNAYNDATAELWVVANQPGATPIPLATANSATANLTNSWPRWTPFVQQEPGGGSILYLTFSSVRNYGIEIMTEGLPQGSQQPQIWMAALIPPRRRAAWIPRRCRSGCRIRTRAATITSRSGRRLWYRPCNSFSSRRVTSS